MSSDLLSIGASGTRAYRAAMGAVSENITNATTEGYNRRTVQLGESPASATTSRFYKPGVAFGGVDVVSVVRKTDDYLDLAARLASSNYEKADARATWLGNIQTALDDGSLGVGQRMTSMFSAVEMLAANPTDVTRRTNVLFAVEQVNTAFKQTIEDLHNVKSGIITEAGNEVHALNSAAERLASTNEALRRAIPGSSNQAQLFDQRDEALVDIAKRLNVTVSYGENGAASVSFEGKKLVDNIDVTAMEVNAASDGTLSFAVGGAAVGQPGTGSLAGLVGSAEVNADRVTAVNDLATKYKDDMNGWHKAGLIGAPPSQNGDNILSMSGDASTLTLLITDTAKLATYSADGRTNGNLVNITSIRDEDGVENGWTAIISTHANMLAATNAELSAASSRDQQAQAARADVSGVDLDREAADLMRLQQAYQGSARIIQVARETLDAIFAIF
ncbi:flagellar hook-associated protein FlgK [Sphingobium sufflavum]|uniref:flagellar hook-associated protein FlgK n=1 Tax=Sphingobium sufflavum TaxID=1129547 RepID=UPI001F3B7E3D|nr:flagellar hook-associated protein FlgK [Sphingobium sufflavum]MCE7797339.1 flagellar hook-associated protein FlgK [Sphingobium sufflavum]